MPIPGSPGFPKIVLRLLIKKYFHLFCGWGRGGVDCQKRGQKSTKTRKLMCTRPPRPPTHTHTHTQWYANKCRHPKKRSAQIKLLALKNVRKRRIGYANKKGQRVVGIFYFRGIVTSSPRYSWIHSWVHSNANICPIRQRVYSQVQRWILCVVIVLNIVFKNCQLIYGSSAQADTII